MRDSSIEYRPEVDGLRALAVLLVLAAHFFPKKFPGAFIGVDIFFVISGFLISSIIFKELKQGSFTFKHFYSRRINRIFPSLIVIFLFCFVLGFLSLYAGEFKNVGKQIAVGSVFSANILFYNEIGYWDRNSLLKPLLHLWSLGIEEQFYLFWPILLIFLYRLEIIFQKIWMLFVIIVSVVCSYILTKNNQPAAFYLIFSRLWELAAGGMLSLFLTERINNKSRPREISSVLLHNILSIVGIVSILFCALYPIPVHLFPGTFAIIPVVGSVLIIFSGKKSFLNSALLGSRPAVYIGRISYPLYLWHWPLLSFLFLYENGAVLLGNKIKLIILSFLLASLTYHLVENPIKKTHLSIVKKAVLITAVMSFFGISGFLVFKYDGFPVRYKNSSYVDTRQAKSTLNPLGLIGDSNAGHLVEGLRFRLSSPVVTEIKPGWPFLLGVKYRDSYVRHPTHTGTPELTEEAVSRLAEREDIKYIVISNNYEFYAHNDSLQIIGKEFKGGDIGSSYAYALEKTLKRFFDSGKEVIFVKFIPMFNVLSIESCSNEKLFFNRRKPTNCSLDLDSFVSKRSIYNEMIKNIKIKFPKLIVIESEKIFCDTKKCVPIINNALAYRDPTHLNILGSIFVADEIIKFLE